MAQFGSAPQPGVKLRGRSFAELYGEQKSLLSSYCRLDFEGARLQPAGWSRFRPYTSLRANPEFSRIVIVTRFDIETPEQPSDELMASYQTVGFYQQGEGYTAVAQTDRVQFQVQEQNGNLLVTAISPDVPHVSPRAAIAWMNLLLNDPKTSDPERVHLKDALQHLSRFQQPPPAAPHSGASTPGAPSS